MKIIITVFKNVFSWFDKCSDSISHSQIALEEVGHGLHVPSMTCAKHDFKY